MIDFDSVRARLHCNVLKKYWYTWRGNHFVELNEDDEGNVYIVIHSGSRNLGKQVAEYYQNFAYEQLINVKSIKEEMIERLTKEGRQQEIHEALREIKKPVIRKELAYLEGQGFKDYMNDMKIAKICGVKS